MPNWKVKTPRDAAYLKWLRGKPCVICSNTETEAHHTTTGGMGIKGSDYEAIPACRTCHDKIHRSHGKQGPFAQTFLDTVIQRLHSEYGRVKP